MDFKTRLRRTLRKTKKKAKKIYKKVRRLVRKYIRMLVRHTKAHDYTILIYSILALILIIFLLSSFCKLFTKGKKKVKTTTEITTEFATPTNTISKEEERKRELATQCKNIYEKDKDFLILVSTKSKLPENYEFEHYMLNSGYEVDERIVDDLKSMLEACNDAGFEYNIVSGFRDKDTQQSIIDETINKYIEDGISEEEARKKTLESVQDIGCSEHETGLTIDITSEGVYDLTEDLKNDLTNAWLMNNCQKYGFIVRYPENKQDITGISFEPWHLRYVGKDAANIIHNNKLTLEEFYELVDYCNTF